MRLKKIPSKFDLLEFTIDVKVFDFPKKGDYKTSDGFWDHKKLLIELSKDQHPQLLMHNFVHETVHAILDCNGYEKESKNEQLVDALASGFLQILKTME